MDITGHCRALCDLRCFCRQLTGIRIESIESAQQAMECLHQMGARTVVLSSSDLGSDGVLVAMGSAQRGE